MKKFFTVFLLVVLLCNSNCIVLANDIADGIRIEGVKEQWSNEPYEIMLNVTISEGIREINVDLFNGGNYENVYSFKPANLEKSFTKTILFGDIESKLYEGVSEWKVSAWSDSGTLYSSVFTLSLDYTGPVIKTNLFGDYGYEVMFDYGNSVEVNAIDNESGMELLKIYPSYSQHGFVSDDISPYMNEGEFKVRYTYPNGKEYGYVLYAKDKAGNYSTRIIMTRYNITSKLKRTIPRGNYDKLFDC